MINVYINKINGKAPLMIINHNEFGLHSKLKVITGWKIRALKNLTRVVNCDAANVGLARQPSSVVFIFIIYESQMPKCRDV